MSNGVNMGVSRPLAYGFDKFDRLDTITSGRYNKGELRLNGDGQFEKVNNFVWHTDQNDTILTNDQNVDVRTAVFDCLNDKFTPNGNRLDDVRNFLLGAEFRTSTLTRDEVHNLIKLFKNVGSGGDSDKKWNDGMADLRKLAYYKHGVADQRDDDRKAADRMLKGNGVFFQDSIRERSATSTGIRASGVKFFDPGGTSFVAHDSESMIAQLDKWQRLRNENNVVVDYIASNGQRIVVSVPENPTPDTMLQIGGEAYKLSEFVGRGTFRLQPKIEQRGDGTFVMNDFNTMKERIGEWRKLEGFSVNVAFGLNGRDCNIVIPRNVEVSPDLQFQIMGQDHKLSELVGKGRFYLQPKVEQPQPQVRQQQPIGQQQQVKQPQVNQVQVKQQQDLKTLETSIARTLKSGLHPYFFENGTQQRVDELDILPESGNVKVRTSGGAGSVEYEMKIGELPQSPMRIGFNTQSPGSGTCFLWGMVNGMGNARSQFGKVEKDLYRTALDVLKPDKDGFFTTFDENHKPVRESLKSLEEKIEGIENGKDKYAKAFLFLVGEKTVTPVEKLWLYKSYLEDTVYRESFKALYDRHKGDLNNLFDSGLPPAGSIEKTAQWLGLKWEDKSRAFDATKREHLDKATESEKLREISRMLLGGNVLVVNQDNHFMTVCGCDPNEKTLTCIDSSTGKPQIIDLTPGTFKGFVQIDVYTQYDAEKESSLEKQQEIRAKKQEEKKVNKANKEKEKEALNQLLADLWAPTSSAGGNKVLNAIDALREGNINANKQSQEWKNTESDLEKNRRFIDNSQSLSIETIRKHPSSTLMGHLKKLNAALQTKGGFVKAVDALSEVCADISHIRSR